MREVRRQGGRLRESVEMREGVRVSGDVELVRGFQSRDLWTAIRSIGDQIDIVKRTYDVKEEFSHAVLAVAAIKDGPEGVLELVGEHVGK